MPGDESVARMIRVQVEECSGCGACVEACPTGSIHLVEGKAVIETQGCDACLKCVEACPSGALSPVEVPQPAALVPSASAGPPIIRAVRQADQGQPTRWAAASLWLLTQEIAPRLAEALVRALERRMLASDEPRRTVSGSVAARPARVGGPRRRRWRRRARVKRAAPGAPKARSEK
ncbi:MAG: 4Fe-4S binding protein [Chloroflexota bacterium]